MLTRVESPTTVPTVATLDAPPPAAAEAAPAEMLPAPDYPSGDPMTMIAELFAKSAQQTRKSDELAAQVEERAEDAADAQRILAMKDKAEQTLTAGMVGGASMAASGACSLGAGATGLHHSGMSAEHA